VTIQCSTIKTGKLKIRATGLAVVSSDENHEHEIFGKNIVQRGSRTQKHSIFEISNDNDNVTIETSFTML
jgi:hypothetical protein